MIRKTEDGIMFEYTGVWYDLSGGYITLRDSYGVEGFIGGSDFPIEWDEEHEYRVLVPEWPDRRGQVFSSGDLTEK